MLSGLKSEILAQLLVLDMMATGEVRYRSQPRSQCYLGMPSHGRGLQSCLLGRRTRSKVESQNTIKIIKHEDFGMDFLVWLFQCPPPSRVKIA